MKSDIPIRRLLQVRPEDWISFLFPALAEIKLADMPTDMITKTESRMDNVKKVNNEFISHIEPNGTPFRNGKIITIKNSLVRASL